MATITCTVDGTSKTIKVLSISGTCWAKLSPLTFEVKGSEQYDFVFSHPNASTPFDTSDPVDFDVHDPKPSWLNIQGTTTVDTLTIRKEAGGFGSHTFLINDFGTSVTIVNIAGSGGGTEIPCYLSGETGLVGTLPPEVTVAGEDLIFGFFEDPSPQQVLFLPEGSTVLQGLSWNPSLPAGFETTQTPSQIAVSDTVSDTDFLSGTFTILTNGGGIDPTIVNNPEEQPP